MKKGFFQVYTGEGKGKTTAAIGLAVRAAGHGLRTFICQFLKGRRTGEFIALKERFSDLIDIYQCGSEKFVLPDGKLSEDHIELARRALQLSKQALVSGNYDIVILDEINVALKLGLVELEEVLALIEARPEEVELVFTGRDAHEEVLRRADLVTEMREVRHYYRKGITARKGIEY